MVAKEGMSYAKAISSLVNSNAMRSKPDSAHALEGRPDSAVKTVSVSVLNVLGAIKEIIAL